MKEYKYYIEMIDGTRYNFNKFYEVLKGRILSIISIKILTNNLTWKKLTLDIDEISHTNLDFLSIWINNKNIFFKRC